MGKGKRNSLRRDQEVVNNAEKIYERQQKEIKKSKTDKVVAIVCVLFAVLIAASLLATVLSDAGVFLRVTEAASGKTIAVDAAMMTFFMNNTIMNFYNENYSYLGYYSLDLSADLRYQPYGKGYETYFLDSSFDGTWYEYFLQQVINEVEIYVTFAEAAKAEGMSLTAEEKKEVAEEVAAIKENLKANGAGWSDWFGRGVSKADVRKCCELIKLYNKYYEAKKGTFESALDADDTALNTYVENNKATFYSAEVLSYEIGVSSKGYDNDEAYDKAVADAKAAAEKIAGAKSPEEFAALVDEYKANDAETETSTETEPTVEEKIEDLKDTLAYETDDDLGKWLFEEGAKENDAKVIEETGTETETETESETETAEESDSAAKTYNTYTATAYYVTKASALDKSLTKDYAYLATGDKAALEAVVAAFKGGEQTKEAFVAAAEAKYNEIHDDEDHEHSDTELFEFNAVEKMSEPMFNDSYKALNEWIDSDERVAKTLSEVFEVVVEEQTYYAVIFFDDYNDEAWYANAYSLTIAEQLDTWYEDGIKANPLTFNDKVMNEISTIIFTATATDDGHNH